MKQIYQIKLCNAKTIDFQVPAVLSFEFWAEMSRNDIFSIRQQTVMIAFNHGVFPRISWKLDSISFFISHFCIFAPNELILFIFNCTSIWLGCKTTNLRKRIFFIKLSSSVTYPTLKADLSFDLKSCFTSWSILFSNCHYPTLKLFYR